MELGSDVGISFFEHGAVDVGHVVLDAVFRSMRCCGVIVSGRDKLWEVRDRIKSRVSGKDS